MRLGDISKHFESGDRGPGTISPANDPGGKSYGSYQLSRDTLKDYLQQTPFIFLDPVFSTDFDQEWKAAAEHYTIEFELDQYLFITRHLYLPCALNAKALGFTTSSRRVQETIYSMAVQHGRANEILRRAFEPNLTPDEQVAACFRARRQYVQGLESLSEEVRNRLLQRYQSEERRILAVEESRDEGAGSLMDENLTQL